MFISLLGNIINNAIEATSKPENEEERVISILTEAKDGLILIHEENFLTVTLLLKIMNFKPSKRAKHTMALDLRALNCLLNVIVGAFL